MSNPLRRWTLNTKTCENLRELGGYACLGGVTRYGVLLRSDQMYNLAHEDKIYLINRGLTDVIDLRSANQQERYPNDFHNFENVIVHGFQPQLTLKYKDNSTSESTCMGDDYIKMLDKFGEYYVKVLDVFSRASGLVIIHCMAGKDRTGIVSALILLILGVDERDVIADYQVSETFLKYRIEQDLVRYPDIPRFIVSSEPRNMQILINHLNTRYGGAYEYLHANGLTAELLERIQQKLVASE